MIITPLKQQNVLGNPRWGYATKAVDDPFGFPLITCVHNSFRDKSFSTLGPRISNSLHLACGRLTSATNILKHYKWHVWLGHGALWLLYKHLRNTPYALLTYLLAYLLTITLTKYTSRCKVWSISVISFLDLEDEKKMQNVFFAKRLQLKSL